jgi:hypothetical protein
MGFTYLFPALIVRRSVQTRGFRRRLDQIPSQLKVNSHEAASNLRTKIRSDYGGWLPEITYHPDFGTTLKFVSHSAHYL